MDAPEAVSILMAPVQIVALAVTDNGTVFTVTVTVVFDWQPVRLVPIMVYVVVEEGDATTWSSTVEDKPVDGDHEYEFAPEAVNVVAFPGQMVAEEGLMDMGAPCTAVTVTFADAEHPDAFVPVRVKVVVMLTVGV